MKILIVSHGNFARGLCDTLNMFFNENDVSYISLSSNGVEYYAKELRNYLEKVYDEVMILCDLQGGTPFNQAVSLCTKMHIQNKTEIVAGVNLPMLLQLYALKDKLDVKKAKVICEDFGKRGIIAFADVDDLKKDKF